MADRPHPFFAPQGGSMRSAAPTSGSVDLVEPGRLCRELLARGSLDQRDDQGPTMTAEALLDGHYREHVSALFDRHAADFEPLLLGSLQYETPAQLERALLAFVASTGASDGVLSSTACLDLGCGTGLAGALLRSVRRAYLRASLGHWKRLRSAEQLARRVLRAATIACARRCLAHWARWRQVGRMARRAQHVRLQRLQRQWLRALVSAHQSARRLAAGRERVSASARGKHDEQVGGKTLSFSLTWNTKRYCPGNTGPTSTESRTWSYFSDSAEPT